MNISTYQHINNQSHHENLWALPGLDYTIGYSHARTPWWWWRGLDLWAKSGFQTTLQTAQAARDVRSPTASWAEACEPSCSSWWWWCGFRPVHGWGQWWQWWGVVAVVTTVGWKLGMILPSSLQPTVFHRWFTAPTMTLLDYLKHPAPSCDAELRCHLWELFSAPRVTPAVRALNGRARRSFDLKHFWDLGETAFQRTVLQDILLLRPLCVMLSPPCTMVCQLQHSNWRRMKYKDRFVCLREALGLIDFSAWVAMVLLCLGLFFAMEHPEGSLAWTRDSVPLSWMLKNWFALATSTSIHTYQVKPSCNQTN